MKEYVCSVCGYIYRGEIPDDFICPVCGAGRDAFVLKEEIKTQPKTKKSHFEKELSPMEMSVICSNLARGCEKQYLFDQAEAFKKLSEFFNAKSENVDGDIETLLKLIETDLSTNYPYANDFAEEFADRGAKRALLWSEKVTRILLSILNRYKAEGKKMLENTGIYVCSVCGFVFVGNKPPEICPVCKVPTWKFDKIERRA